MLQSLSNYRKTTNPNQNLYRKRPLRDQGHIFNKLPSDRCSSEAREQINCILFTTVVTLSDRTWSLVSIFKFSAFYLKNIKNI